MVAKAQRVIIDTDPGIDDAAAIWMALGSSRSYGWNAYKVYNLHGDYIMSTPDKSCPTQSIGSTVMVVMMEVDPEHEEVFNRAKPGNRYLMASTYF